MGGANKLNGDSNANANKPLPQRQMRQYQGTQSNSSLNYGGEPQSLGKPMHGSHGGHPGQNSNSPPLQTGVPQQQQQQQQQQPPQLSPRICRRRARCQNTLYSRPTPW